ncbi:zinc finger protein [Cinnamomum micranthum f. kanehirae]|uniref:Zinc finger protein n=1 Tax=Cinnamomum micranthum f. kanehirae TaxID=337451 RepID=A0A443NIZ9_9MAGN|nr:zinc finger protein [Cinnamomum micranthum f. kanehirae]
MMNPREDQIQSSEEGVAYDKDLSSFTAGENVEETCPVSSHGVDKDGSSLALCRVCPCVESDTMANAALAFLNIIITPPSQEGLKAKYDTILLTHKASVRDDVPNEVAHTNNCQRESPNKERFICSTDVKGGFYQHQDALINLGCSCKSDLAIAHYACALKWFISHGSTVCEICHSLAKNIKPADFKKVKDSLKELRKMAAAGQLANAHIQTNSDVDPDDAAAFKGRDFARFHCGFIHTIIPLLQLRLLFLQKLQP